jgi:hypothetical protein
MTDPTSQINFGDDEIHISIPGNGNAEENITNSGQCDLSFRAKGS